MRNNGALASYLMATFRSWTPVAVNNPTGTQVSAEAQSVLEQLDGNLTLEQLSDRTKIDMEDLLVVMGDLVGCGAIDTRGAPQEIVALAKTLYQPDTADIDSLPELIPLHEEDDIDSLPELLPVDDPLESLPELEEVDDPIAPRDNDAPIAPQPRPRADPQRPSHPPDRGDDELEQVMSGLQIDERFEDALDGDEALFDEGDPEEPSAGLASFRQMFEKLLHPLPKEVRIDRAHTASGEMLCALCLDPVPAVIQAVLENSHATLVHGRLIAEHHRNPVGLDALSHRADMMADATVRRMLLRNNQAPDRLVAKSLMTLALVQVFRANVGHDLTERARRVGRAVLRHKYMKASSEEKVALIIQTEGRCLSSLIGTTFDQKTVSQLCGRTYQSTMLVQSLGRFSATPPNLIAHLMRQQIVVRSPHLKKVLQQHKNCPKYLKF